MCSPVCTRLMDLSLIQGIWVQNRRSSYILHDQSTSSVGRIMGDTVQIIMNQHHFISFHPDSKKRKCCTESEIPSEVDIWWTFWESRHEWTRVRIWCCFNEDYCRFQRLTVIQYYLIGRFPGQHKYIMTYYNNGCGRQCSLYNLINPLNTEFYTLLSENRILLHTFSPLSN